MDRTNRIPIRFTNAEFARRRDALGLTQEQLARLLRTGARTVRKWEASEGAATARAPNPIACVALEWFEQGWRPPDWPVK